MHQERLLAQTQILPWKSRVLAEIVSSATLDDDNIDSVSSIPKAQGSLHFTIQESIKK